MSRDSQAVLPANNADEANEQRKELPGFARFIRAIRVIRGPFLALVLPLVAPQLVAIEAAALKFDFGDGPATPEFVAVPADAEYSASTGFGFEEGAAVIAVQRGGTDAMRDAFVTSEKPFAFSAAVPEGIYQVTVVLGDAREGSTTTIKSEARRLMVEKAQTAPGKFETRTFTVAVKRPNLKAGGTVRLKPDEIGHRDWDEKLTLEFSNARPCVCSLVIEPAANVTTVFIAGDSTVTDQRNEPYVGWGQMLPRFFTRDVVIANHAESGESLRSSLSAKRFDKIFETIRPGDYLFIQFGHNDQKDKSPGAGPFTTYKEKLRSVVARVREKKALPVIVTSMERRFFEGGKIAPSLADFAEGARQVSREENVPLIDLHAMSIRFYEALGPERSRRAFVHFPAGTFPGQAAPLKDDTHFTSYGGYMLARCVVEGIRAAKLDLAKSLATDLTPFDPAGPMPPPEDWNLPVSASVSAEKPEGN